MQEKGNTEELEGEGMDAVDALTAFIEQQCKVVVGMGLFVRKDEFEQRFHEFCENRKVEPPSRGVLGNVLVTCWRPVWGGEICGDGGQIPVWRNLAFKNRIAGGAGNER